jgi:hypothetical protein
VIENVWKQEVGDITGWWKFGNGVLYGDYLPDLETDVRLEKWILKQ